MKQKSIKKYAGFLTLLALFSSSVSYADSSYVSGTLNRSGHLVQYDYTRTHTFDGPISLSITDLPAGYLRLGLRNMNASGGPQFTDTLQWNVTGTKEWGDILRGTRFAFQGRMPESRWGADTTWGGYLTY